MKRLFLIYITLLLSLQAWSQNTLLPSKCDAFLPNDFLESAVLKESTINNFLKDASYGQNGRNTRKYWVVYSDREKNKAYKTPGGTQVHSTLNWNEPLRIARISGKYALVYSEPNKKVTWPKISTSAKEKGWVPMENLLLWDSSLADDKGILYKALICHNTDAGSLSKGHSYFHPTDQSNPAEISSGLEFYYILKRDKGGKVLLARSPKMTGDTDQVLFGWLSTDSYIPWNQRSCIEPTWDEEHVDYFASQKAQVHVYDTDGDIATTWTYGAKLKIPVEDEYIYRMNPEALRFPLLDATASNPLFYECSSFGAQDVEVQGRRKEFYQKLQNINLTIVIDGTESMKNYFPAVYDAIQKGCEFFDEEKYKIKVGVVIYRDYLDGDEGLVEVFPFSKPNDPALLEFLQKGGKYGIRSADRTYAEALYYGMNTALDKLKVAPGESNVMLVVGDCGNAENDTKAPSQEELEKKLLDKQVNLLSFQVSQKDHEAWRLFNKQLPTMNKNILQAKYDDLFKGTEVKSRRRTNGYVFMNSARNDGTFDGMELYFGEAKYATAGTELKAEELTELMQSSLQKYAEYVKYQITLAVNSGGAPTSKAVKESTGYAQNQKWLEKKGLLSSSDLLAFRGTTPRYYKDDDQYPLYKEILFITSEEFTELLAKLEPVNKVAESTSSNNRDPYIDAIKQLIKSFAPGITSNELTKLGYSNITKMIKGLNASSEAMDGDYTLYQIAEVISADKYRTLVGDFSKKYKTLRSLKNKNYDFVKEFNGVIYYWIPIEYLP